MPQVLIRNVSHKTLSRLKSRAKQNSRSLQAELKEILEREAPMAVEEFRAVAAAWRKRLAGRKHSDSGELQAQDRLR